MNTHEKFIGLLNSESTKVKVGSDLSYHNGTLTIPHDSPEMVAAFGPIVKIKDSRETKVDIWLQLYLAQFASKYYTGLNLFRYSQQAQNLIGWNDVNDNNIFQVLRWNAFHEQKKFIEGKEEIQELFNELIINAESTIETNEWTQKYEYLRELLMDENEANSNESSDLPGGETQSLKTEKNESKEGSSLESESDSSVENSALIFFDPRVFLSSLIQRDEFRISFDTCLQSLLNGDRRDKIAKRSNRINRFLGQNDILASKCQEQFMIAMNARSECSETSERGLIDMDLISNYRTSTQIFSKEEIQNRTQNHSLEIWIDLSTSMVGKKMRMMIAYGAALGTFCHRMGIPFRVHAFYDFQGIREGGMEDPEGSYLVPSPGFRIVELMSERIDLLTSLSVMGYIWSELNEKGQSDIIFKIRNTPLRSVFSILPFFSRTTPEMIRTDIHRNLIISDFDDNSIWFEKGGNLCSIQKCGMPSIHSSKNEDITDLSKFAKHALIVNGEQDSEYGFIQITDENSSKPNLSAWSSFHAVLDYDKIDKINQSEDSVDLNRIGRKRHEFLPLEKAMFWLASGLP